MKMKQLGRVLLTILGILMMCTVGGNVVSAGTDFELVMVEHDGDLYYVEKTDRFDLEKPIGVAVALGGGGARALVNVGVLKALEEEQIPIDLVIGTSMGAIVAVLYGSGMSVEQIEQLVTEVNLPGMFYVNFPFNKSLISTKEINYFIEKVIPVQELGEFPIPTALLSHDLTHGVRYIATTGRAAKAVGGPYAIPLCFPGEKVGESYLIDAGVWELTPAEAARVLGAQVVIATEALDALPFTTYDSPLRSWARMINLIKEENAVNIVSEYSDVVISHDVGDYSFMDFHLAKSFIDLGYSETKKRIPEIKRALSEKDIALRIPEQKYAVPMANVLRDVRHDRQVLDPLVVKPVYYYGKDHSLTAQKLFQSPLYRAQFGLEVEYQNLNGLTITQGTGLDNLDLELRWKKLLPQLDLMGRFKIAPNQEDWEVELKYFLGDLVLGTGYTQRTGKDYLHFSTEFALNGHLLTIQGETDLLVNVQNPTDYHQYEYVASTAGKYPFTKNLFLQPKVVLSNSQILNAPQIYRGHGQEQFSKVQTSLELVYEKRFPYSLEIIQVIQMVGVEYVGFIDYQAADDVTYALGAGVSADVNLLGIKPSRLGGYLAYEPIEGNGKFGFDLDVTF